MDKLYVKDLEDQQAVQSIFLVREKNVATGKNGRPFMSLTLADRSGMIDGRVWDNVDDLSQRVQVGDLAKIKGNIQLYQNRKQMIVHTIEVAKDDEYSIGDFMPATKYDIEDMFSEVMVFVKEMKNDQIRQLTLSVLQDPDIQKRFKRCPAAKTIHHAYIGGLLEHTLSICRIMKFLASHYKVLDLDLLIFGAIFHDLGKIWEISYETSFSYTDEGRLVGHLVMVSELIEKRASQILGFPEDLKNILKHIVLSHHGRLDYGSPKRPKFLEAFVVSMIDDLDSKVNHIQTFMDAEMNEKTNWTRLSAMFERYFYIDIYRNKLEDTDV